MTREQLIKVLRDLREYARNECTMGDKYDYSPGISFSIGYIAAACCVDRDELNAMLGEIRKGGEQ